MPLVKSKRLKELKAKEQEEIRRLYATNEYSVRDLAAQFRRSKQYIMEALHAVDKLPKKPLTK